ncbi:aminotransferase class V-fold PLP-dependent enzyme [Lactobacillus sp. Sy-1]|uniref:aminotransferase class V-fold PLP-dependent enzyme n=1 Tax=Lactobacillus sp. Sy-1 TaxID=2109645 RepID=UPI001C5B9D18|nr:cysteine desulfurase [Lactobacillus sp. Sy-1]MBW1606159.1 cysteine desulfurase [Lactobacillus sp. Sy-1]
MIKSEVKTDFPILKRMVNGEPMVYLDNAATSQKPQSVIDKLTDYYVSTNANVHRGVSTISVQATDEYEAARSATASFINAPSSRNIVFTRSTTESLNWIASGYADNVIQPGDEIVITVAEHHSNIVPWQQVAKRHHATLKYVTLAANGQIDMADAKQKITDRTKIVSINQVSNVMGAINPVTQISEIAHQHGAVMVVDAAQSAPHIPIDVQAIDADFLAFSGHKMLGPTGIGVLYGKAERLAEMQPVQFGGEMIDMVTQQTATFQPAPLKFEAGTPNIAGAIGLHAAIDYLNQIGMAEIHRHDQELTKRCIDKMKQIPGIIIYGDDDPVNHNGVVTFNVAGIHPHDVATGLDMEGIEVRAGHHCAQPLMNYIGVESTVRVSFYFYNSNADVDRFIKALETVKEFFANEFDEAEPTI